MVWLVGGGMAVVMGIMLLASSKEQDFCQKEMAPGCQVRGSSKESCGSAVSLFTLGRNKRGVIGAYYVGYPK